MLFPILIALAVTGGLALSRHSSLEGAIGTMLCVSVAASPTTWSHYFVLLLVPVALLLRSLRRQRWPRTVTRRVAGVLALLALPFDLWVNLGAQIAPVAIPPDRYWTVWAGLVGLTPAYLLLGL